MASDDPFDPIDGDGQPRDRTMRGENIYPASTRREIGDRPDRKARHGVALPKGPLWVALVAAFATPFMGRLADWILSVLGRFADHVGCCVNPFWWR